MKQILIVGDSPVARESTAMILRRRNPVELLEAEDGCEVAGIATREGHGIIVMGARMPNMNGFGKPNETSPVSRLGSGRFELASGRGLQAAPTRRSLSRWQRERRPRSGQIDLARGVDGSAS